MASSTPRKLRAAAWLLGRVSAKVTCTCLGIDSDQINTKGAALDTTEVMVPGFHVRWQCVHCLDSVLCLRRWFPRRVHSSSTQAAPRSTAAGTTSRQLLS